jgi:hypothetical protein
MMSKQDQEKPVEALAAPGWRIKLGFALFLISLIGFPLLIPLMALIGLSGERIVAISGGLVIASELVMIAGAAIAGKDGFAYIKRTVFGYLKPYAPPATVSRTRYRIGLVLFCIPLLIGWAAPYFGNRIPGFADNIIAISIVGDVMLAISLFVLGGDFWDKLRSLFVHRATVRWPH